MQITCLNCGMVLDHFIDVCPKCDNALDRQHDGSTITVDIAHQGERVREALHKMHEEIERARKGVALHLRFIVGSGLIRDEVMLALRDAQFRGDIQDFDAEGTNRGAILVRLK